MSAVSDYSALRAATQTFRILLREHITNSGEADLAGVQIDLRSPRQLSQANVTTAVSLWLYRVTVQPDMLNAPVPRGPAGHARRPRLRPPPEHRPNVPLGFEHPLFLAAGAFLPLGPGAHPG